MNQPLSSDALAQLFTEARTFNGYLDKPVPVEMLHALWDLMKMGPTSANQLPARIVWCISQEAKDKLAALASGNNAPKIQAAPVAAILAMDENFHDYLPELYPALDARSWFANDEPLRRESAFRNSSLQGGYFILAARALGLGVGPMSGFDKTAVDAAFFPDQPSYKSNFIATLGYGDPEKVHPRAPRPEFGKFNRID